jgi:hypothetical protein
MMPDEIEGEDVGALDEHEHALLSAYREQHAMPSERRERVWASLAAGVPPGGGESALASSTEPWLASSGAAAAKSTRPALLTGLLGLLGAASLTLALIGWSSVREREAGEPAQASADVGAHASEPAPLPVAAPPRATTSMPAAPRVEPAALREPIAATPPSEPEPPRPRPRARPRDTSGEPAPSLGRERALIEQVHAALAEGDTATARARLDEHARDYAEGVFVQEREALAAIVDCKSGALEPGRELAEEFLRAHPHAVLAARVRRACKLDLGSLSDARIGEGSTDEAP